MEFILVIGNSNQEAMEKRVNRAIKEYKSSP